MFRPRPLPRCLTAILAIMSLLFAQLALANYVCPGQPDMTAAAATAAVGDPCEGMDTVQPVLCHQQSTNAGQSFEVIKVVSPSLPAVIQVLVVVPVADTASAVGALRLASTEARPPPGALFLSTLRLRV